MTRRVLDEITLIKFNVGEVETPPETTTTTIIKKTVTSLHKKVILSKIYMCFETSEV